MIAVTSIYACICTDELATMMLELQALLLTGGGKFRQGGASASVSGLGIGQASSGAIRGQCDDGVLQQLGPAGAAHAGVV